MARGKIGFQAGMGSVTITATLVAIRWPLALPVLVIAVIFLMVAVKKPNALASVLVIAAIPLMRPNVLSENFAVLGTALCLAAALVAFANDRGKTRIPRSYMVIVVGMVLTSLWLLINASVFGRDGTVPLIVQGFITTVLTVAAAGVVLADPSRRRIIGRGFVWMMLGLCASYAVTFVVWMALGVGTLPLATFPITKEIGSGTIYFPITPSFGMLTVNGITFPRFTGLGREPGWMSLYAGLALLLWPRVGRPILVGRMLLVLGLLGAFSTAGFGAFVVVLILAWIVRKPKAGDLFTHYIGFCFKLFSLAGAAWVAVAAPVFGLASKGDLNAVSLGDRTQAMNVGLGALAENPFGGVQTGSQSAINLIAALAPLGIPYFVLVTASLLIPMLRHPSKSLTTAPIALIFFTLLLSQPAGDSTFAFILAGLVYTLALPDMHKQDLDAGRLHPYIGMQYARTL